MLVDANFCYPCDFLGVEKRCKMSYTLDGSLHFKNVKLKHCSDGIKAIVEEWKQRLMENDSTLMYHLSRDPKWCFLQGVGLKFDVEGNRVYLKEE